MRGVWSITSVLGAVLAVALVGSGTAEAQTRPNVVLVLTDDQRWDTLNVMPTVQSRLAARGVTFDNAFVVNPVCCPSRASTLTGRYSHSTGVYNNGGPFGGWGSFRAREGSTIATWLKGGGYRTGFFGKYLNNYGGPFVPPGWSRWVAFSPSNVENYYTYRLNLDGTLVEYGADPGDYSTDVLADQASSFIRTAGPEPLFVLFAPFAPHGPPTPAPRHEGVFAGLPPWRPPSYNEPNARDKPAWVRSLAPLTAGDSTAVDSFRQGQLESLLAVDDAVGELLDTLADTGRLDETLFVFTSDNGYLWGEHRWRSKIVPYDESIRVPLVVRYDGVAQTAGTSSRLVANIDLAPTIARAAGVAAPGADGRSFLGLLPTPNAAWRPDVLVENRKSTTAPQVPSYCVVRNATHTYVQYGTGEEEIYDMAADPDQLTNRARSPALRKSLVSFRRRTLALCNPPPPGMTLRSPCLIAGNDRANRLRGTAAYDYVCAKGGADRIEASSGDDLLYGGHGDDLVYGEGGHDRIYGGLGLDRIYGGIGRDVIYAADGRRDVVGCGEGVDTVYVNPGDVVSGCERIRRG
ncbi:MAG: sulfatase-like hydrolase/transferase [Gaiellaceae bacterium]